MAIGYFPTVPYMTKLENRNQCERDLVQLLESSFTKKRKRKKIKRKKAKGNVCPVTVLKQNRRKELLKHF